MVRFCSLFLFGVTLGHLSLHAEPADKDKEFNNALALNSAIARAEQLLNIDNNPKKAVEILEADIHRVNGNTKYLKLLGNAYRSYVKQLWFENQPALAKRYVERLSILDPAAANDASLKTASETPHKEELVSVEAVEPKRPISSKTNDDKSGRPTTVRAKTDDFPIPRSLAELASMKTSEPSANKLLSEAEKEYARKNYLDAYRLYDQVYQADPKVVASARDRYAYCILNFVKDQVNEKNLGNKSPSDLLQQVTRAQELAPKYAKDCQLIQKAIELRNRATASRPPEVVAEATSIHVQHLGQNREGWQVSETPHFLIFHHQDNPFAEKVAQILEKTRREISKKWFGTEQSEWTPKCELILHPTATEYTKMTSVPGTSPGHSRIESDPNNQRVVGRRMDIRLDNKGALEAVVPHETTHIVLAGQFGQFAVPRWADEGIAVLSEPADKIEEHRVNLLRFNQEGKLFGLKELIEMDEYPHHRRIGAFYAQSVLLVEFLAKEKGAPAVIEFVREGLRSRDYESALRHQFGMDFNELENRWRSQVLGEASRIAARNSGR